MRNFRPVFVGFSSWFCGGERLCDGEFRLVIRLIY